MKVLIDAQLPKRLAEYLLSKEIDAKHTLELPNGNSTTDSEIIRRADQENRIVITKDSDFLDNFILEGRPKRLLMVTTGNITNDDLVLLFDKNIKKLTDLFKRNKVIELDEEEIQIHY